MNKNKKQNRYITAVVADENGNIFDLEGYAAVGMDGPLTVPLTLDNTASTPFGGELMFLPDRIPLLYNLSTKEFEWVRENPHVPGEGLYPVAVFNSPGYVVTLTGAFKEKKGAEYLPLFSYGAVGWFKKGFRSAVICVDRERRQDLRLMPEAKVLEGVRQLKKIMPENRLRAHLEKCALTYGCPAGKNFFLGRYEAPLPTARQCNARCLGCLSHQETAGIPRSQDRIAFIPSPAEIAEVAMAHIDRVKNAIVSFGQGCEGEPLLLADILEESIRLIRSRTTIGTVNLNTNGSLPDAVRRLCDAGLDAMRVSMNSPRPELYDAYFKPRGYGVGAVIESLRVVKAAGKHTSINLLCFPGVTDTEEELEVLSRLAGDGTLDMIQMRNLNIDPDLYREALPEGSVRRGKGMRWLMAELSRRHPALRFGYFNPACG